MSPRAEGTHGASDRYVAILASGFHGLGLRADGTVESWGTYGSHGQAFVPVGIEGVRAISAGKWFDLAVTSDGSVIAWGVNNLGQCDVPTGLSDVIDVCAGFFHSLALRSDGTVVAWGANFDGQLDIPASVYDVVAVSASGDYSLAVRRDGSLIVWGGEGDALEVPPGANDVVAVSGNVNALLRDGTVVTLGGDRHNNFNGFRVEVPEGLVNVTAISAGHAHRLALKKDGTVVKWGTTNSGGSEVPDDLNDVVAIAAGFDFSLALRVDGTVVGWGKNTEGQLHAPTTRSAPVVPASTTERSVSEPADPSKSPPAAVAVAAGSMHSVALLSDGTVTCWGDNSVGQLNVPQGLDGVTAIAAGEQHTLALRHDGSVVTWGQSVGGRIGQPPGLIGVKCVSAGGSQNVAVLSSGDVIEWRQTFDTADVGTASRLSGVEMVAQGANHGLALHADGTVSAWGWKGTGATDVPPDLRDVVSVAVSNTQSFAILRDSSVVVWGGDHDDPMKDAMRNFARARGGYVDRPLLRNVRKIAIGETYVLALTHDKKVVAWGYASHERVHGPMVETDVADVAVGANHSLVVRSDGHVLAWGQNALGECDVPALLRGTSTHH